MSLIYGCSDKKSDGNQCDGPVLHVVTGTLTPEELTDLEMSFGTVGTDDDVACNMCGSIVGSLWEMRIQDVETTCTVVKSANADGMSIDYRCGATYPDCTELPTSGGQASGGARR